MSGKKFAAQALFVLVTVVWAHAVHAQQRGYSGLTAADIADEQEACAEDADRFCGGNVTALFEMESCLSRYTSKLSATCRPFIRSTDFRHYHNENLFD